ncbi:MAG: hypothetical protein OXG44_08730, partial [Gammaproteobacteria bacterium]|nr:hypothetical protein [Gammaproteobacteria bacterium]
MGTLDCETESRPSFVYRLDTLVVQAADFLGAAMDQDSHWLPAFPSCMPLRPLAIVSRLCDQMRRMDEQIESFDAPLNTTRFQLAQAPATGDLQTALCRIGTGTCQTTLSRKRSGSPSKGVVRQLNMRRRIR